jgi:hypothetical protein
VDNIEDTKTFTTDIENQSGVPVLLIPTPRGTYFPSFVKLPNVNENQANFIIESWKAFTGQQDNPQLVKAVYDAMKMEMSQGKPDIGVLQSYINHYITILESEPISGIGTGADVGRNIARLNINNDGHLYLQSKLGDEWFDNNGKPIVTANQLPPNIMAHLGNLLTTIKFTNSKNKNLVGINSTAKVPFVTIENGKVKTTMMTYNEYIMQNASTYVEEGIQSKNKDGDWIYFANPVIKMSSNTENIVVETKTEVEVGDTFEEPPAGTEVAPTSTEGTTEKEKVAKIYEQLQSGEKMIFDFTEEEQALIKKYDEDLNLRSVEETVTTPAEINVDDIFANLDRVATANEMTDEQIKEQQDKC